MINVSSNFSRRRSPLVAALAAVAIGAASLAGCTATEQAAVTTGLATACGVSQDIQAAGTKLSTQQTAALSVVSTACSNPTTAAGIASTVATAILTLTPIVASALKSGSLTPAQAAKATALIGYLPEIRRVARGEPIDIAISHIEATPHLHAR